jgi:hypothetical protein
LGFVAVAEDWLSPVTGATKRQQVRGEIQPAEYSIDDVRPLEASTNRAPGLEAPFHSASETGGRLAQPMPSCDLYQRWHAPLRPVPAAGKQAIPFPFKLSEMLAHPSPEL